MDTAAAASGVKVGAADDGSARRMELCDNDACPTSSSMGRGHLPRLDKCQIGVDLVSRRQPPVSSPLVRWSDH